MITLTVDKATTQGATHRAAGFYYIVGDTWGTRCWVWWSDWALAYFATEADGLI